MKSFMNKNHLESLEMIDGEMWGSYLLNKFFIKINTRKSRGDIPSYDFTTNEFSIEDQIKLQKENYPAIYHEFIHYIHEITTMAGIVPFYYTFASIVSFTACEQNEKSSDYPIEPKDLLQRIKKTNNILLALDGTKLMETENLSIIQINNFELNNFIVDLPNLESPLEIMLPVVNIQVFDKKTKSSYHREFTFGRLHIYEGLAQNIDRIVQQSFGVKPHPKRMLNFEYLFMEKIAKHIFSGIQQNHLLQIASLSLSYLNCSEYFIYFIERLKKSNNQEKELLKFKQETASLLRKQLPDFEETMTGVLNALSGRNEIQNAYGHLIDQMITGMKLRIENPVFEIDIVYSGVFNDLEKKVTMCPMMYTFNKESEDTFIRDYTGTNLENGLGGNMLILLCFIDYFKSAIANVKEHICPLYTSCNHKLRQKKGHQCKTKPRLSFEDRFNYGPCYYSAGIFSMKGY
ncbi:hypothetical protein BCY89_27685 [Sphingobacterium siyangense]|uniref:Uncharacterized protein n=2 Tax=Sphingobacterium siyangense TaxID=459529 RepID=A0A420FXK9_9SPHI|nr:hypothetical protein BCY89_27685 [Sphingobacterium siyangense]